MSARPRSKKVLAHKTTSTSDGLSTPNSDTPTTSGPSSRLFPLLLLLFLASGCAALIYEIVWFQLLELTIGSSAISIAVLLATYMGGMCVGSLGLARVVPVDRHPLKVYAFIEFGIGLCGLAVLWLLPYAGGLYHAFGGHGVSGLVLRSVVGAIFLLVPTVLMGATLPAVSRWIEGTPLGVSWLGFLYGVNTLGAVAGCLFAGFYLLRVHDMFFATYVAVAINALAGASGLWLSRKTSYAIPPTGPTQAPVGSSSAVLQVLLAIGLSGLTALSAEVVWTRLLALQLDATVYAYSLILAAILLGLSIGSYVGSLLTRLALDPRTIMGWCQAFLTVGIAWSAYQLTTIPASPTTSFQHDLALCLWTVMPAALLWGASFPLAIAAVVRRGQDHGRSVGLVYAANTFGAIVGALMTPLVGMAWLGSQHLQQLLICLVTLNAMLLLLPFGAARASRAPIDVRVLGRLSIPLLIAVLLLGTVRPVPGALVGYGRYASTWKPEAGTFIYVGEGMNASVAISRLADGVLNYHNAGKVQASSEPQDLRLERMLGHLTTLIPDSPKSVLVIGFGAGVTAGAVSVDPRVEQETIVDIEPLVSKASDTYFAQFNEGVARNPKTTVLIDDGRHYVMTSRKKFDAITLDPFDPWTKGAASLSTREFFASARDHLNPGGALTVWVPLYQTSPAAVKSEIAAFTSVFPNAVVWGNTSNGVGYDVVLSGRAGDAPIDVDAIESRLMSPEYAKVRESLLSAGFTSGQDLLASYAAQGGDLAQWLSDAEVNTDRNLRLQYLAGAGIDDQAAGAIYADMIAHRTWPEQLFTGSGVRLNALQTAIYSH